MGLSHEEIADLLTLKAQYYNNPWFIVDDPVSIPHQYRKKEDIEISGFLAATIAWGQRPVIIRNAQLLMQWMDERPHEFILNASERELAPFLNFKHRTFNGQDCVYFIRALQGIYLERGGLEQVFTRHWQKAGNDAGQAISGFRDEFLSFHPPGRTAKHIADPLSGSSAKRINMFLRWMVRKDDNGVDFGLWENIPQSELICPLDLHTGNVARLLGILKRKANDWRSARELTDFLRLLDPSDPVKYDYALFGLGIYEKF